MNRKLGKKGQVFDNLSGIVVAMLTIAIVLAVGFLIMSELQDTVITDDDVVNATLSDYGPLNASKAAIDQTISATATIPDFLDIIVITVIGAVLLGLVSRFRGQP